MTSPRRARAKPRNWRLWGAGAILLLGLVMLAWVFWPEPEVDLEAWLAERDLVLNAGFAGHYLPGTVVRTHRLGEDGVARKQARPDVVLWPETCFPGKTPRPTDFPLPRRLGRRQTALHLGGEQARKLLPSLGVEGAESWDVEIVHPRLKTFALADLARQFSEPCLDRLEEMFDGGTDPAWLATIVEAVVADELRITVEWQAGLGAEARADLAKKAAKKTGSGALAVEVGGGGEGREVLEAKGPVVVAYRLASMVPVKE